MKGLRPRLWVLSLALAASTCPGTLSTMVLADPANVTPNPSLEQDENNDGLPDGFARHREAGKGGKLTVDAAVARTGQRSVKLANPDEQSFNGLNLPLGKIHFAAGELWEFSCWIKAENVSKGEKDNTFGLYLDATKDKPDTRPGEHPTLETFYLPVPDGTFDWTRVSRRHRFRNDCTGGALYCPIFLGRSGTVWCDDVAIVKMADAADLTVKPFESPVPTAAAQRDRHTLFLASFDSEKSNDADYARADSQDSGRMTNPAAPGKFGGGVSFGDLRSSVVYRGLSNADFEKGTASFWVRGPDGKNVWTDGVNHWLLILLPDSPLAFGNRPAYTFTLEKSEKNEITLALRDRRVALYALHQWDKTPPMASVALPTTSLAPAEWHFISASWDLRNQGRLWLSMDGKGVTRGLTIEPEAPLPAPGLLIYLGSIVFPTFEGHLPWEGSLDDLKITDLSPVSPDRSVLPKVDLDESELLHAEDLVRAWLDLLLRLQEGGGWEAWYDWPSLRQSQHNWFVQDADDFCPECAGVPLLRAYELWGDERYLRAAQRVGDFFVQSQTPAGCWCQYCAITSEGPLPQDTLGQFEEQTQSMPLRFLAHLYRVTGNRKYLEACKRGGEFVLSCQDKAGWWPWGYDWQNKKIAGHGGPTLNDDAFGTSMEDMLIMHGVTNEQKYLDAFKRAADWLIVSQTKAGPTRGWAEQYDMDNKPCWGRHMEPPAVSMTACDYAVPCLLTAYDVTGDVKYLRPIELCLDWLRGLDGKWRGWLYYDLTSGEPIMAYNHRIFSVFSEEFKRESPKFSAHFSSGRAGYPEATFESYLKQRERGPVVPYWSGIAKRTEFSAASPAADTVLAAAKAKPHPTALNGLEAWLRGETTGAVLITLDEYAGHALNIWQGCEAASLLLDFLDLRRAAFGDFPLDRLPRYSRATLGNWVYIDPRKDWYDTPLCPSAKLAAVPALLRVARQPVTVVLPVKGRRAFELRLRNTGSAPVSGEVLLSGVPAGLAVKPDIQPLRLAPGKEGRLAFTVASAATAALSDALTVQLKQGGTVEAFTLPVEVVDTGGSLDSGFYRGRCLLDVSLNHDLLKLVGPSKVDLRMSLCNRTFETLKVKAGWERLPDGATVEPKERSSVLPPDGQGEAAFHLTTSGRQSGRGQALLKVTFNGKTAELALPVESFNPDDALLFEAEAANRIVAPMTVAAEVGASGGKCVHHPRPLDFTPKPQPMDGKSGGYLEFPFNLARPGNFILWLRCYWLDSGGNSFYVSMDGGEEAVFGNDERAGWHWVEGPRYSLAATKHVLEVRDRETGAKVDQALLVRDQSRG